MKVGLEIIGLALIFWLESIFPLFQKRKHRFSHARSNLALGLFNGLVISLGFSALTLKCIAVADANAWGLLRQFEGPGWIEGMLAFILFDLWMYNWHRANHRAAFLWQFHRVHHSDVEMDSTSAFRFHTGEILFSSILRLIVVPVIGMEFIHLLVYESCLKPIIIFHHSNIALPEKIDRILRTVIVTPNMHRVHHSQVQSETDSNYSSVFSWWDRLAGTFRKREDTRAIIYGLSYFREMQWQSLWGMLKTPFVNVVKQENQGGL